MSDRGRDSEVLLEGFLGSVFVEDFVLRSPTFIDRGLEKELCDHIVQQSKSAIIIQLKTQNPASPRDTNKETKWVAKQAREAVRQVAGAVRTLHRSRVRSEHSRRGAITLEPGQLQPRHGLALIELLDHRSLEIPGLRCREGDVSIHVMTPGDFVAIARDLQTVPDLFDYFSARSTLPESLTCHLGNEESLLAWYLTNASTFAGLQSIEMAIQRRNELLYGPASIHLQAKQLDDQQATVFANLIDRVHWQDPGITEITELQDEASEFGPNQYLRIAYELNSLRRVERREIVRQLRVKCRDADLEAGVRFFSTRSRAGDCAFLFAASRDRTAETRERLGLLTKASVLMAQRANPGILRGVGVLSPSIVRRDKGCDFAYVEFLERGTEEQLALAERLFSPPRVVSASDFPTQSLSGETTRVFGVARDDQIRELAEQLGIGRNDPCPCGLPRKFKNCHGR